MLEKYLYCIDLGNGIQIKNKVTTNLVTLANLLTAAAEQMSTGVFK
jgi:hypothetical protein